MDNQTNLDLSTYSRSIPVIYTLTTLQCVIENAKDECLIRVKWNLPIIEYLLSINDNIRKPANQTVLANENAIRDNGYIDTDMLKISKDKKLTNGQHRLIALRRIFRDIEPGNEPDWYCTIKLNISQSEIECQDTGRTRNASDTFCRTTGYSHQVSSVIRLFMRLLDRRQQSTQSYMLERVLKEYQFDVFFEKFEFPDVKSFGIKEKGKQIPSWFILACYVAFKYYGESSLKEALEQFYNEKNCMLPMCRIRSRLLSTKVSFAKAYRKNDDDSFGYRDMMEFFFGAMKNFVTEPEKELESNRRVKLGYTIAGVDF